MPSSPTTSSAAQTPPAIIHIAGIASGEPVTAIRKDMSKPMMNAVRPNSFT